MQPAPPAAGRKRNADTMTDSVRRSTSSGHACTTVACHLGSCHSLAPRFLRLRDAPSYLGMDKNRFNREVRPRITIIPIGVQGIAFDRLDLDAWADEHKRRNGCPGAQSERTKPWETTEQKASPSKVGSGTSTNCSEERAFAKALQRAISPKPRSNSSGGQIKYALQGSTGSGPIVPFTRRRQGS